MVAAGAEFAGLPGSKIAAVKAEAMHGSLQAKSGTPPPQEQGALTCQVHTRFRLPSLPCNFTVSSSPLFEGSHRGWQKLSA